MYPYVGITDFVTFSQVRNMLRMFNEHKSQSLNRKLHVGVMMSYKTLYGIKSRWQDVFPSKEKIAHIFSSNETYNCLHYADYNNEHDLRKSLSEAISFGGIYIHAVQLDMIWPDPGQIKSAVHSSRKQIEVILQIGKNAFDELQNDPWAIAEKLSDYDGVIHRVLLDKSMGKGHIMDANELLPYAKAIKEKFPNLGLVVAGGLGPSTVGVVKPLIEVFSDLSIDAQGRLRPSQNAIDPINWSMAGTYLVEALKLFDKN